MKLKHFYSLTDDWPLDKHFKRSMRQAILDKAPEFYVDMKRITDVERRWLSHNGFDIQSNNGVGRVKL